MKKHSSIFFKTTALAVLLTILTGGAFAQAPGEGTHNVTVATGCGSYTWSANGVSYQASGIYTYAYENTSGEASVDTLKLTIYPVPNVKIKGNDTVCFGVISGLKATGATTYWWWHTADNMAATINTVPRDSITVTLTEIDTFIVVGTNSYGCQATDTLPVLVLPLPSVVAHAHTSRICKGQSVVLTAEGASAYSWSPGGLLGQPVEVSPKRTTTYWVTGVDDFGCRAKASITVEVEAVKIMASPSLTVCEGESVTLTASGAFSYSWNYGVPGATTPSIEVVESGVYIVTGHHNGCNTSDTAIVTVHPKPNVTISGNDVVCPDESSTLTASGADEYSWSNGQTTASIEVNAAGVYTVTGTDSHGCSVTVPKLLTNGTHPIINVTGAGEVCSGSTLLLSAENVSTCVWKDTLGNILGNTPQLQVAPTENMLYKVYGEVNGNNCSGMGVKYIRVYPLPEISIISDSLVCEGGEVVLAASSHYPGTISYIWPGYGNGSSITVTQNESQKTYTLVGVTGHDCRASVSKTIRTRMGVGQRERISVCGENRSWHGQVYFTSGTYISSYATFDEHNCPCYDTLDLILNYNTGQTERWSESEYYYWDKTGQTYYYSGTYTTDEYPNSNGCMTADTLHLTIINEDVFQNDCMIYGFMVKEESCDPGHDGIIKLSVDEDAASDFDIEWNLGNGQTSSSLVVNGVRKGSYPVKVKSLTCPDVIYYEDVIEVTREDGCRDDDDDDDDGGSGPTVSISGPTSVTASCEDLPSCTYTVVVSGGTPPYSTPPVYTFTCTPSGHTRLSRSVTDSKGRTGHGYLDVYGKKEDCPHDPNLITGPEGYTEEKRFVNATDKMEYRIDFENDPNFATAPATRVKITYDVPAEQNLGSFRLGEFGFGSFIYSVPSNVNSYYQRIDVSDSLGVWVDVTAGLDIMNHQLFWIFQSIDPATGAEPVSSQIGFLPINDSLSHGEGYVTYYISPNSTVATGDTVAAQATIVFDDNESIETNVYVNTFDAVAPTSTLIADINEQDSLYCTFTFDAQDDANGSGVKEVEVLVSKNNGPYRSMGTSTPDSSVTFALESGMHYQFMSIATDNVNNKEASKIQPDTVINYNTAPIELMLSGNTFYEYDPKNTLVGTLSTVDDDMSQPFVYTLVSGVGDDDNALFTIEGNMLKTDTTFVCSRDLDYYVRVRTTDFGGLYCERSFRLKEIRQHVTPTVTVPKAICEGESIDFYGTVLSTAGSYSKTLQTPEGCDSIVVWVLTVNPIYNVTRDTIVCNKFVWNDSSYMVSDTISHTYILATGCDSTVTYNLTVNHSSAGIDTQIACDSLTWIDGITYYASTNTPTFTLTNAVGCDSLVTLNLTVNYSTESFDKLVACDSLTWIDGITYTESTSTPTFTLTNAAGCDSVVTLMLTVLHSTHNSFDTVVCESYTWNGVTYTQTGTYTHEYTNGDGCASADTLHLTVYHGTHDVLDIVACDSYAWHGVTYTQTGTYTHEYTNSNGCASADTLHLTVHHGTHNSFETVVCESYVWHGVTYTQTGTYTHEYTNSEGCVSVDTLHLTVHYGTHNVFDTVVCESYVWNGVTYTQTGTYTYTYDNASANGCASIDTLHLTVLHGTHNSFETVACESYVWNGVTYTQTGTYTHEYTNSEGCASVDTLHLTVHYGTHNSFETVACDSYAWNGVTYTQTGTYIHEYTNSDGCASADTLHLTVHYGTHNSFETVACESYVWNGVTYTQTGTYTHEYTNSDGCASVDTLHLTVHYGTHNVLDTVVCESYVWNGVTYTQTGTYTHEYTNNDGCSSADTLHLTVYHGTHNSFETVVCESYVWNGVTYTQTGTYTHEYTNNDGCASVDTLHLTVHYGTHNVLDTIVCESYVWNGVTYTQTGTYTHEYTNGDGCGSADTLHLTVYHGTHNSFETVACDSYVWNGVTYTQTGTYTHEYTNSDGCSSADTLHLTVLHGTNNSFEAVACESYAWNYVTYTESGTYTYSYTNANGCVCVDTLHLTIYYGSHDATTVSDCESYVWHGSTYTESGTYTDNYTTANGCASSDTLYLTINHGTHNSFDTVVCGSYVWNNVTYTTSGSHTYNYTNANGCASVDTLHLTVYHTTTSIDVQEACDSYAWIDGSVYTESVTTPSITLTSAAGCDSIVTLHLTIYESTSSEFSIVTHDSCYNWNGIDYCQSGDYVQTLQTEDGCDSVVTLHLTIETGIDDHQMRASMNVYPNPTNDNVTVQLITNNNQFEDVDIQLYDMYGKWLGTWKMTGETTEIDLSTYAAGIYFIKAVDGQRMIDVRKVVKE